MFQASTQRLLWSPNTEELICARFEAFTRAQTGVPAETRATYDDDDERRVRYVWAHFIQTLCSALRFAGTHELEPIVASTAVALFQRVYSKTSVRVQAPAKVVCKFRCAKLSTTEN